MTEAELRRPFGTILDEQELDYDEPIINPRKSLAMMRRRRRSSARFLRLAGTRLDLDDDEEEEDNHAPAQQELGEMYKKAIQLNAENKLNSKNSWGLRLIENLDKFLEEDETVDNEKEKRVNFTKASCTLDASVKIYSYRVDDVHLSSYKVLANLNRNDDNKKNSKVSVDHENDGDGENKKPPPLERRSGGVTETIETNLANINLNKLDSAFDIDPLFHKMSKTFDEGGAKGLLLANLGVGQHGCNIVFDSKEADEEEKVQDENYFQDEGMIDISSLNAKLESILSGMALEKIELVPQLRTLREELRMLSKDGYLDDAAPKNSRRYASSMEEEKDAEMSIHQEALERSRASQGTLVLTGVLSNDGEDGEYASDDFGGDDDQDDGFSEFIAADENGGRYSSSSFQNETFMEDSMPGVMSSQMTNAALLDALCTSDVLSGNDYEFFSQATLEKLSQGNVWAGSKHWTRTERMQRKLVQSTVKTKAPRKKASKEPVFVNLSDPICLDDILLPAANSKGRKMDSTQLSKMMKTKHSKNYNLLPLDAGMGIKQLSTLFMRPNDAVRTSDDVSGRGKTVGFHNAVDTFGGGGGFDDGDSFGGDDDGPGFTLADEADDFVVKELEGVRKVEKTRVGFATVATIVDVKRLKKDLWSELEITFEPPKVEETGEEENETKTNEEEPKKLSFNDTVRDMSSSQSQNDVTLPFYFICLLHLANEKGLRLDSQGLEDFFISVDDGAEPSVGALPTTGPAPRVTRKKDLVAIVESDNESVDSMSECDL